MASKLDGIIICIVLLILWILLLLPAIFYYIPGGENQEPPIKNVSGASCSYANNYTGQLCLSPILSMLECDASSASTVRVINNNVSLELENLLTRLQAFDAKCAEVALPFLCLFIHEGVCDENGVLKLPTSQDCTDISTGICQNIWKLGQSVGVQLPLCDDLPQGTSLSPTCFSTSTESNSTENNSTELRTENTKDTSEAKECPSHCNEKFICDNNSSNSTMACVPLCSEWNLFSTRATAIFDIMIILSAIIGAIAGVTFIMISIYRREKMIVFMVYRLTFPSVMVFYENISIMILIVSQIIAYIDRGHLFCTSSDLLKALSSATGYCIFTGMLTVSIPVQIAIWYMTHLSVLYWTILFPVKAQSKTAAKKLRIVHITSLLVGLFYPILPILIIIGEDSIQRSHGSVRFGRLGFGLHFFPPTFCTGLNSDIVFYVAILPNIILIIVGITTLVLIIWTVHKKHGIIKSILHSKASLPFSTAEVKLVIILLHYTLLQIFSIAYFSQVQRDRNQFTSSLLSYFACERNGADSDNVCSRENFEHFLNPGLYILSLTVTMLLPISSLVFAINFQAVKLFLVSQGGRIIEVIRPRSNIVDVSKLSHVTVDM